MRAGFLPSTRSTVNRNRLVFGWNGQPYSDNIANPGQAGDIFHYLGRAYGRSTWSNPAGTSRLSLVVSSNYGFGYGASSVLTDRTAATTTANTQWLSANAAGSWLGFQLEYPFIPSGFAFQTGSASRTVHPRNFRLVGSSDLSQSFSSTTNVAAWPVFAEYLNQTQVNQELTTYYFPVPGNFPIRRFALLGTGPNSGGMNYLGMGEIFLFGELLL